MFRDEHKNFIEKNTVIIGMSADSVKTQKNFCTKQEFPFLLLSDPEKTTIKAYEAFGWIKFMGKDSNLDSNFILYRSLYGYISLAKI